MRSYRRFLTLSLIACVTWFCSCDHAGKLRAEKLADTIRKLKEKADFRPLNEDEEYYFLNRYYLPGLDTLPTKRKIFIYPLAGANFKKKVKDEIARLEAEFNHDTTKTRKLFFDPPDFPLDSSYKWDVTRLTNTTIVDNAKKFTNGRPSITEWHKKFGYGYMIISYPLYNPNTKILQFTQWEENFSWCGTGRDSRFVYERVPGGWKIH
jgi:hypothetical protein